MIIKSIHRLEASEVSHPESSNVPSSHSPTNQKIETAVQSLLDRHDGFDWQLRTLQIPPLNPSTVDHDRAKRKRDEIPFDSLLQLSPISNQSCFEEPETKISENELQRDQTDFQPQQYESSKFADQPIENIAPTPFQKPEVEISENELQWHHISFEQQQCGSFKLSDQLIEKTSFGKENIAPICGEEPVRAVSENQFHWYQTSFQRQQSGSSELLEQPIENTSYERVKIAPITIPLGNHSKNSGKRLRHKTSQEEYQKVHYDKTYRAHRIARGEREGASLRAQATAAKIRKSMMKKAKKNPSERDRIARVNDFVREYLENKSTLTNDSPPKRRCNP
jgi:hypothetical protein